MAKKRVGKKVAGVTQAATLTKLKRPTAPKVKPPQGLSNAELRELMKSNKPPQSWYEEDHTGLY